MPRSIYYPADQLEQCQVERIENIEEVLHRKLAPGTGIQQEHRDRHQAPQLLSTDVHPKDHQTQSQHSNMKFFTVQLRDSPPFRITAVLEKGREHRHHAAPEPVVDLHDHIEQIYNHYNRSEYESPESHSGPLSLLQILERTDEQDTAGEGDQDAHIQAPVHQEIDHLTPKGQQEDLEKIPQTASGIPTALGDHVRKYRECQATDDAKQPDLWEEHQSRMITKHRQCRNDLQCISGQQSFLAGHHFTAPLLSVLVPL